MNIVRYLALRCRWMRGMTVVHVGAHLGQEAASYERSGAKRVVWIEGDPAIHERLVARLAAMQSAPRGLWPAILGVPRTEHVALQALVGAPEQREASLHRYSNDGNSNSMFQLRRGPGTRFAHISETETTVAMPVRTLDEVLESAGIEPSEVDVLVVDVQGAELLCLKGASRTLAAARYLQSEVSVEPVYEGGVLLGELEPWLAARGFTRRSAVRRTHTDVVFGRT